jgi:hypothetical protein
MSDIKELHTLLELHRKDLKLDLTILKAHNDSPENKIEISNLVRVTDIQDEIDATERLIRIISRRMA